MNLFLRGTGTDPVPAGEQQTANSEALAAVTCGGFFCFLRFTRDDRNYLTEVPAGVRPDGRRGKQLLNLSDE